MDILLGLAETLAPLIIGMLTVPVMNTLKKAVVFVDNLSAPVQQIVVVLIAWGLTHLTSLTNVVLPESLHLVTGDHIEALLSAAIAFGIHAGKRAKEASN